MSLSNVGLLSEERARLYCQPLGTRLGHEEYDAILESYMLTVPPLDDKELGLVLLFALTNRFPCSE
jgi:hypothetical protein